MQEAIALLATAANDLATAMERLGTGYRINSAADDAAGLQIANRLEAQTRGMNVAIRNSQDAISMMQTAEGALEELTNITYRMKDLAIQSANGVNTDANEEIGGAVEVAGATVSLPGVRLALWVGGAITVVSGLMAYRRMTRAQRAEMVE